MSFIYDDKKLIDNLLKSAIDFENKFLKKGQKPIAEEKALDEDIKNPADKARIALSFLDDIENPGGKKSNITSNKEQSEDLDPMNMSSLGSLIEFLVQNEIMVDLHRIAYDGNTPPQDLQKYALYKLEGDTLVHFKSNEETTNSSEKYYYINNGLLVVYLKSLQAEVYENKNSLMARQLKGLIEQANSLGLQVSPYQPPSSKPGEKPAEQTPGQPEKLTQEQLNALTNLASETNLPLMQNTLDLGRIKRFLAYFKSFLQNTRYEYAGGILKQANDIEDDINKAFSLVKRAVPSIGLSYSDTYQTVAGTLKDLGSYIAYVDFLAAIVSETASIVQQLYAMYPDIFNAPQMSGALRALKEQDLFKSMNLTRINGWRNNANRAMSGK